MNLVKLNLRAYGRYSEAEYNETIFMIEDDYKILGIDLKGMKICIEEFDGEYSEVDGNVEITIIKKEKQENYNYDKASDGVCLICEICDIAKAKGISEEVVKEMIVRADEYVDSLDSIVEVTYKVKKSQVKHLDRVFENLW